MASREWNKYSRVVIIITMTIIVKIQIKIGNTLADSVSVADEHERI